MDPKVKKLQAIVLLPTRELSIQVAEEVRRLGKFMHGIKVLPIYGGQDIVKQIRSLKDGTQVIIGTRTCDGPHAAQNRKAGLCEYRGAG